MIESLCVLAEPPRDLLVHPKMGSPDSSSESDSSVGSDWDVVSDSVDGPKDRRFSFTRSLSLYSDQEDELGLELSDERDDFEVGGGHGPAPGKQHISCLPALSLTESQFLEGPLDTPCAGPEATTLTSVIPRAIPRPASRCAVPKPPAPPVLSTKPSRPPRVVTPRPLLSPPDQFDQPRHSSSHETDVTKSRKRHRKSMTLSRFMRFILCQQPDESLTRGPDFPATDLRETSCAHRLPPVPAAIPRGGMTPMPPISEHP